MRLGLIFLAFTLFVSTSFAQDPAVTVAVANGRSITLQDLPRSTADAFRNFPRARLEYRVPLIENQIKGIVLEIEAKNRNITVNELLENEVVKKVPDPTEAEIKNVFEKYKAEMIDVPYPEIKKRIIAYLRMIPERLRYDNFITSLKKKYPARLLKDIRLPDLKPMDKVLVVGPRTVTFGEFSNANGNAIYEYDATMYDKTYSAVKQVVDALIYDTEAKSLGIPISELIAREITNQMQGYSETQYSRLQKNLEEKLYKKYGVKILLQEPEPFAQSISADDDPFTGAPNAPITVVMFSDFQCPACAGAYPALKKVMAEYPGKIRFVVRDFPLVNIHDFAFTAAIAANAAKKQGKYFEYTDLLYGNQESLDDDALLGYAKRLNLDLKQFMKDFKDPALIAEVERDMRDGNRYGVSSTPTIFVNGVKVRRISEDSIRKTIDRFAKRLDK